MKKSLKTVNQEQADKILEDSKKKQDKKPMGKKAKMILASIITLLVVSGGVGGFAYYNHSESVRLENERIAREEADRIEIRESLEIETASKVPTANDFVAKKGSLSDDLSIEFVNIDEEVEDKNLQSLVFYFDEDGNDAKKDEALDKDGSLNEGFVSGEYLTGIGEYQVKITDNSTELTYESKLIVTDTEKPELKVRDVEVTEGDSVEISQFIESCTDNSRSACLYKVVDDEGNTLESIDKSVGEREIKLVAYDNSGNETDAQTAKLTVKEKEKPVANTNTNTGSTTKKPSTSNSGSTSKPSSNSGNSSNNTGSTSSNTGGGTSGGKTRNQCKHNGNSYGGLTIDLGCGSTLNSLDNPSAVRAEQNKYDGSATTVIGKVLMREVEACNASLGLGGTGTSCRTLSVATEVNHLFDDNSVDVSSVRGWSYGIVTKDANNKTIAEGHINADMSITWKYKNY